MCWCVIRVQSKPGLALLQGTRPIARMIVAQRQACYGVRRKRVQIDSLFSGLNTFRMAPLQAQNRSKAHVIAGVAGAKFYGAQRLALSSGQVPIAERVDTCKRTVCLRQ